ncbi:MAG: hypothetical protein KDD45_08720 [Bdellovibrionales bacterium]|nr:hypothetical protein [Bdellovibrionales bacterium]
MNQGKGFWGGLLAIPLMGAIALTIPQSSNSQTVEKSADDIQLEQRIMNLSGRQQLEDKVTQVQALSLAQGIAKLRLFKQSADAKTVGCVDTRKMTFANKYVMSFDEQGAPCRIYDLSFPNIQALFTRKKVTQVPVRKITSKDYLNLLDGNLNAINRTNYEYQKIFNPLVAARGSWVSKLKFKYQPTVVPGSKGGVNEVGLPQSFSLADLNIGDNFHFNKETIQQAQILLADLKKVELQSGINSGNGIASEYFTQVMNKPETILQGIRFNWNDLDKVYDVVLEADFLPIKGPVVLVDYQRQYKFAVEKMFRGFLSSALESLTRVIANPIMSSVVNVVVTDAFEQLELMYDYQMLQLEDSLKTISKDEKSEIAKAVLPEKALNILYGQRSDLFSSYILSVVQKKEFDWQSFDKLGRTARYNNEKQRQIMMGKMNSKLVLEKKCQVDFFEDYFAICSKDSQQNAIYSLISDQALLNKDFGAPMIYRYARPYETSVVRGLTWVLSAALRVVGLPLSRTITYQVDSILKGYMRAGLLDEALLRNKLYTEGQKGNLTENKQSILKWLYIQNLNPFLPKSSVSENNLITINKQLLGLSEQQ